VRSPKSAPPAADSGTRRWHDALRVVSCVNVSVWLVLLKLHGLKSGGVVVDSVQLALSACYVLGCAFRAFYPRADLQRIVVVDSPLSAVFWGRSVATVAELAYAWQLSRWFGLPLLLPLLTVAELFSWYAILSNRAIFNLLENSLWTLAAVLIGCVSSSLVVRVGGALFVLFMVTTDLPMYYRRHVATPARQYRGVREGALLLLRDYRVTAADAEWREEWAWQLGYFSIFVWTSLFFTVG
jgi:hypothetical protein